MGWPQITLIALTGLGLGCSLAKHGEPSKFSFTSSLISNALLFGILYWGGFFG